MVSKDAVLSLVNVSANEKGAKALINLAIDEIPLLLVKKPKNIVEVLLKFILDKESRIADACCMVLSNLTRSSQNVEKVIDFIEDSSVSYDGIVNVFTKTKYNSHGANLHYLGPVLSNLSQSSRVRRYILDRDKCVIQRLIAFTDFRESLVRRGGVVGRCGCFWGMYFGSKMLSGTLKNCCFDSEHHSWLLSDDVDILPKLLLPLAGNTEYDEEDNDKLPFELQYLPETKEREPDPDIRCFIICLMFLKQKSTFPLFFCFSSDVCTFPLLFCFSLDVCCSKR